MENAAEALKMAAWVLIFVVALSICINLFSESRQTMDAILEYNDKEYDYTYVEQNKDLEGNIITERIVGIESIIPTIYRAYKENYKIIFPERDDYVLYTKKSVKSTSTSNSIVREKIHYIDIEKETTGNDKMKEDFIKYIIFGTKENQPLNNFPNIIFNGTGDSSLYNKIKDKKFKEYLGVYYQEEAGDSDASSTPNANKTKKRVITYEEVN